MTAVDMRPAATAAIKTAPSIDGFRPRMKPPHEGLSRPKAQDLKPKARSAYDLFRRGRRPFASPPQSAESCKGLVVHSDLHPHAVVFGRCEERRALQADPLALEREFGRLPMVREVSAGITAN